jgi:hypothetical protein
MILNRSRKIFLIAMVILLGAAGISSAAVFDLRTGVITKTMPDSAQIPMWGFGLQTGNVTVPGPELVVPPGDTTLTINLQNNLSVPVSVIIPGFIPAPGDLAPARNPDGRVRSFVKETPAGGSATYTWTVKPGTYLYQSGSHQQIQVPMGLYGAVKNDASAGQAYPGVNYHQDKVILFSEIDPVINNAVATGNYGPGMAVTSTIDYHPRYFLINGAPFSPGAPPLLTGSTGQNILLRFLNAGVRDYVPLTQGVYMTLQAEDGNRLPYPKRQYSLLLPAGKTIDASLSPNSSGDIPLYDRRLNLTNNATSPGGLLTYLKISGASPQEIYDLVVKYYNNILDRAPEPGGAEGWTAEIERIVSLGIDIKEGFIAVGKAFFNSDEYLSMAKTDAAYVTDLYETFLNRTPSQAEVDFWVGYLTGGASRNIVLNFFVFSPEFNTYMTGIFGASAARPENNLVNDFYRGILSRLPDTTGFNFWLGWMREAQCVGSAQQIRDLSYQIASLFVNSAEYVARGRTNGQYVEDLYDAIMRRSADPSEVNYWVGVLDGATMNREQVLQFFTNAPEFQNRVQAVIDAGCLP